MDGRSFTLIVALALTGSAFAGCIENMDWLNTNSAEVSAMEYRGRADEAALAWSADARLVGVMAFELSQTPDPRIDSDPDPGNGLAPAWWYVYTIAPSGTSSQESTKNATVSKETRTMDGVKAFKVNAAGDVTSEDDAAAMEMGSDEDAQPLGKWTVDSDAAMRTAKGNASFARIAESFNSSIVEGIASQMGVTAWWISAMGADGFAVASVDAATGELLHVQAMDMNMSMPDFDWEMGAPGMPGKRVHIEGAGVVSPGSPDVEEPFTATSPLWGTITFAYTPELPMDGLHWAIMDAAGEIVEVDHLGGWSGSPGVYEAEIEIPLPGEYTLTLGYMSSVPGGRFLPVGGSVNYAFELDLEPGMPVAAKHN